MSRGGENNGSIDPETGRPASTSFSLLAFERMRSERSALSEVFAFAPFSQVNILVDGEPETGASAQLVSGGYHHGLGVPAFLGRTIALEDDRSSAEPVAVISFRYWERRFGGDANVLGKTIQVNRVAVTIVGVTPQGFDGAMQAGESPDVSVPLAHHLRFQPDRAARAQPWYWWLRVMGRLAPGATPAQVRSSLEPIFQDAAREGWLAGRPAGQPSEPMPDAQTLTADPGGQGENDVRRRFARPLYLLMGLVGLVLAAACANVANLLLARSAARRREIALRLALGASRRRIVSQLLSESLLLAFVGAGLGTALAWWTRDLLLALRPFGNASVVFDLPLDGRVLGFTIGVTVATALLFGLAPALRATRVDLSAQFQGGTRTLGRRDRSRLSQALMVVQVALSLVLLVSTGLFARSLGNLQNVDAGFNRRGLILFRHRRHVRRIPPRPVRSAAGPRSGAARETARGARRDVLERRAPVGHAPEQEDCGSRLRARPWCAARSSTPTASPRISLPPWSSRSSSAVVLPHRTSRPRQGWPSSTRPSCEPTWPARTLWGAVSVSDRRRRIRSRSSAWRATRSTPSSVAAHPRPSTCRPSSESTAPRTSRCAWPRRRAARHPSLRQSEPAFARSTRRFRY